MERVELKQLVRDILDELLNRPIPIGISNRHIHLSEADFKLLFPNQTLRKIKNLKQPGEFSAEQTVSIIGPKGRLDKVRILGPLRKQTQLEISQTDNRLTGLKAPISMSGDLTNAAEVIIKSEEASIKRRAGIVAQRHIHMNELEAKKKDLHANDQVSVRIVSEKRTVVLEDVVIRVAPSFVLEMHIDTDEANAAGVQLNTTGTILKSNP